MKVAQLLYSGLGGHGSVAFSLIAGDREHSWSNAFCFIGVEPLLPAYKKRCDELGIEHLCVPILSGRPWQSWRRVSDWLRQQQPDVLLVHSNTVLLPCLAYGRARDIPIITVEHHSVLLKRGRDWLLSIAAMLFADRIIMLSAPFADEVRRRMGPLYRAGKAVVIPNGVDTHVFAPSAAPLLDRARIGMAARFTKTKRHDLLVEVTRRLREREPKRNWQLTFAGVGEELPAIEGIAAEANGSSVFFEGLLDEAALADWYRSLSIYALASDGEAFSTSILQAMASGLPTLASDVAGLRDQVTAEFGLLLPNEDAAAWVDAILALERDRNRAREMANFARRRCEHHYSAEAMHGAYDLLMREAVAAKQER